MENRINRDELLGFIANAHKHTYAAPKEIKKQHKLETPFLPGHKCYYFKDGEWEYYDGYAGGGWAPGREVVLLRGNPIWAMSYQGKHNENYPENFFQDEVFPFLKKALMNIDDSMPFRGPKEFNEGDFRYSFDINGDYKYFTSKEIITHKGIEVFFQDIMGELIK
jgi:hypothetical protein